MLNRSSRRPCDRRPDTDGDDTDNDYRDKETSDSGGPPDSGDPSHGMPLQRHPVRKIVRLIDLSLPRAPPRRPVYAHMHGRNKHQKERNLRDRKSFSCIQ